MKLTLVKTNFGTFKPAFEWDYENAKKIKAGSEVECEIKQKRNLRFHKKFFALINLVFQNQEQYNNIEHLRRDLIIEAGFYDVRHNLHGVEIYEPKSISFSNMDEHEFGELYSKVVDVIVKYFNFGKEELIQEVEQFF